MQINNPNLQKYIDAQLVLVSLFVDGKLVCEWRSRDSSDHSKSQSQNCLAMTA